MVVASSLGIPHRGTVEMRILGSVAAAAFVMGFGSLSAAAAGSVVQNGSFETQDLSGWSSSGTAAVINSAPFAFVPTDAKSGGYFAYLVAAAGSTYSTVFQTFTATANSAISGFVGFATAEKDIIDSATLKVTDSSGTTTIWSASGSDIPVSAGRGHVGSTGWQAFNYLFTAAGNATLTLEITKSSVDRSGASYAFIDGVVVVPGPIAGAGLVPLMAAGGALWWRRRRRAAGGAA